MDNIDQILKGFLDASKQMESSSADYIIDDMNELECLKLYDEGWKQDGFDYVQGSEDIITYWKKDGTQERRSVRLIPEQQRRWIRELERRKENGEI